MLRTEKATMSGRSARSAPRNAAYGLPTKHRSSAVTSQPARTSDDATAASPFGTQGCGARSRLGFTSKARGRDLVPSGRSVTGFVTGSGLMDRASG